MNQTLVLTDGRDRGQTGQSKNQSFANNLVICIHVGKIYGDLGICKNDALDMKTRGNDSSVIPSCVASMDDGLPPVGFKAVNQAASKPKNTIYDVR